MTIQSLPVGILGSVGGAVYDPGMMTFNGIDAYYSKSFTAAGNLVTFILGTNIAPFTGGYKWIGGIGNTSNRGELAIGPSDAANVDERNKLVCFVKNSAGTQVCRIISDVDIADSADHTALFAYNGTSGSATLIMDDSDADNASASSRVLTTGTLETGTVTLAVGASHGGGAFVAGEIGYFGHDEQYLTNGSDFMTATGPKEIDESGWTEWGSQPLFWEAQGEMDAQEGSAGNMSVNGTITGPA